MNEFVLQSRSESVSIITVDNPPVNALSAGVPEGIAAALDRAAADAAVASIVVNAAGRTFIAGADIKELEAAAFRGAEPPDLSPLLAKIENSPKPVVMAIHGMALGGGMEVAMAAHYRVAAPDAMCGQPEVNLGIIPGAQGTQRLPRLVGVQAALDLCISGKPVRAPEALKHGWIDRVIEGDLLAGAIAFAKEISGRPLRRTRDRAEKLGTPEENAPLFAAAVEQAKRTRRHQTAPLTAIEAIEAATKLPFDRGCQKERELAVAGIRGEQARAMIHAFFAERAVGKLPGIGPEVKPYDIRSIAIIGAGTMGGGIAMACANAGIPVRIKEVSQEALDRGIATVRKNYRSSVQKGRFSQQVMDQRMALITPQVTYDGFDQADLVIEAAFESMALKKRIYAELDRVTKADCVLATNTSTLDIDEIAACTRRPQMAIGTHFFSPAHVMRLCEIVRGKTASKEVVATALALAKRLGKVGVVVGNCRGFVGNRMMFPYMREAQFLVEEGCTPAQVDKALTDFGMAMGIFAVDDMGGIDLNWRVQQEYKHLEKPGQRRPLMLDKLYEMGRWGQKTGAGWYRYDETRKPIPDPEVEALIETTAKAAGIARRTFTAQEIVERAVYAMINEGARILEEGYAVRAADIDVIYLSGYGFPGFRGGPMWYADTVGLRTIYDKIREFENQFGEFWTPAPLLRQLAEAGGTFASWDKK